jgi:hypothetical protein
VIRIDTTDGFFEPLLSAFDIQSNRDWAIRTSNAYWEKRLLIGPFLLVDGLDLEKPRPHWKRQGLGLRSEGK